MQIANRMFPRGTDNRVRRLAETDGQDCPSYGRRGLSLTEVLIAMGILTLGLLGVASVFPVGSFYMQKAEISDKASAIAQSVMSDIELRGMLNPRSWYVMVPNTSTLTQGNWNTVFNGIDSVAVGPIGPIKGTFTRPFAAALNEALKQPQTATDSTLITKQFGSAYVIDPLGISVMAFRRGDTEPGSSAWVHGPAAVFPATAHQEFSYYATASTAWTPWSGSTSSPSSNVNGFTWPIRRVTFRQPSSSYQMDGVMAAHYFQGNDDLSFDFPARDDRPAMQMWDTATDTNTGNKSPLARKWTGDYSWIVTVVPTTNAARDAMATNPEGYAYNVSVVVFHKRVTPDLTPEIAFTNLASQKASYFGAMNMGERAVRASVISTGLNGGELLLTDSGYVTDPSGKNAFESLRSGLWIMMCGPHPNSNVVQTSSPVAIKGEPQFVMNWYQVISIEPALTTTPGYDSSKQQRIVTVRGPEWPWQPSTDTANISNDLCVAICKGAVAVHSKTMRLEGRASAFSLSTGGPANPKGGGGYGFGDGSGFGSSGDGNTTPPSYGAN